MEQKEGNPDQEQGEQIAGIENGEHVKASLKVRHGKNQMAELECKVVITLNRISEVPELVAGTMDKIYEEASKKGYLL